MNKNWLLLPLISLTVSSFAQADSTYLSLLHQMIRKVQPFRTIHYAPATMEIMPKGCEGEIKNEIFPADSTTSLKLTNRERRYLKQQLKTSQKPHWPDHLFPDSKLITDSMESKLRKLNRALYDSIMKLENKYDFGKNGFGYRTYWGFWFSRPVYLRNKSILIFYFMWYHNSGGENNLLIYRKEGNNYRHRMYICGGAW